jgi:metal transporter CNNM
MNSKSTSPVARINNNGYAARRPATQGISKLLFLGLAQISHVAAAPLKRYLGLLEKETKDPEDPSLWLYLTIAATLVLLGGAFAGLTIA